MIGPKGAVYKLKKKKKVKAPTRWQTAGVYLNYHDLYDSCSSEEIQKKKAPLFFIYKNSAKVGLLTKTHTSKNKTKISLFLESTTFPVAIFFLDLFVTHTSDSLKQPNTLALLLVPVILQEHFPGDCSRRRSDASPLA